MSKNLGGLQVKHNLNAEQHRQWCREMLAGDPQYPQYPGNADRNRGRQHGFCSCRHCGWVGNWSELAQNDLKTESFRARRPHGFCPKCGVRAFWAKMSEGQAAVLAP